SSDASAEPPFTNSTESGPDQARTFPPAPVSSRNLSLSRLASIGAAAAAAEPKARAAAPRPMSRRNTRLLAGGNTIASLHPLSEVEPERAGHRAWRHVVRPAERGQEIVERHVVRQVDHFQPRAPLVFVAMEKIVVTDCDIEQVARLNPLRGVVVILGSRLRDLQKNRSETRGSAGSQSRSQGIRSGGFAVARQAGFEFLVGGQR